MLRRSWSLLLLVFLTHAAGATVLSGEGSGPTQEQARKNALASLSESLSIEVKSQFESKQDDQGNYSAEQ